MNARELLHAWMDDVWNAGRLELVADCVGQTYTRHDRNGNRVVTHEEYAEEIRVARERIPDLHFSIDDFAVTDDRIWARSRVTGKNTETDERIDYNSLQLFRLQNGKLVETWAAAAPEGHDWSAPVE